MRKNMVISLGLTAAVSPLLSACGQMMGPGQQGHMINMPFGGLFMVLLVIAIVIFAARVLKGANQDGPREESPLDIIKRRYANGEIDKDQFERMKKDINDHESIR